MSGRARCAWLATCALLLALAPAAQRTSHAAAVLAELTGMQLTAAAGASLLPISEAEQRVALPSRLQVRARRYRAADALGAVLLLHGVHARGIDEPRLMAFARALARGGLDVLTPELPELLAYRLNADTATRIQQLAAAHATGRYAAVGVIGISFAGGLALLSAAAQAGPAPIGYVVTVGAHADLLRLCRYYAGQGVRGPNGEPPDVAPHPYGARVMIREHLSRFVAPSDLPRAQRALDLYLNDRHSEAREYARGLSEGGQQMMSVLLGSGASPQLSQWIERAAEAAREQLTAASPHGRLGGLAVPVYLLHGEGDPIIPSLETRYLAREVPRKWLREAIVTPLLRHAEFPEPPTLRQAWELVRFVRGMYEEGAAAARRVEGDRGD